MQQKLHERVVKLRKIYEGLRLGNTRNNTCGLRKNCRTPATEIRISPQKLVIVTSYRSGALQATSGAPRGFPSIETVPTGIVAHDCRRPSSSRDGSPLGPESLPFTGLPGRKANRPPPIKRQRYPKPLGVRFCAITRDPASVRGVPPSVVGNGRLSLVRRYAGADLKPGWVRG
jgi:hypothetical protein